MNKINYPIGILIIVLLINGCNNGEKVTYNIGNYSGDTLSKTIKRNDDSKVVYYYEGNTKGKRYLEEVVPFKKGLIHGDKKTFHSNGKLKSVVQFKEGKIWNVKTYLDSSGNKLDYGHINEGNGFLKLFYKDKSKLKSEGPVIDGYKEGYWYSYCGNGEDICDSTQYTKGRDEFMKTWEDSGNSFFQEYY